MKKFWGYFGAILLGCTFFFVGFVIYRDIAIPDLNMHYGGIDPNNVLDWLFERLGRPLTGALFMTSGLALTIGMIRKGSRDED